MADFEFMDEGDTGATDLLQEIFLFRNLDFNEARALIDICHSEHRSAGDRIIEENAVGQALYLIKEGEVQVYKGDGDKSLLLATLKRGEMFGEMSLIEDSLTSANVSADTEVELVVIHRPEFEELLTQNETLALKIYRSFCKVLSERLRRTSNALHKHGIPATGLF